MLWEIMIRHGHNYEIKSRIKSQNDDILFTAIDSDEKLVIVYINAIEPRLLLSY